MSLPSTTILGTLALGTVGAVIAAGAALGGPSPTSPRSDQQPITVTSPSALPCPAGTEEREDECLKIVVAPADPAPFAPVQARPSAGVPSPDDRRGDGSLEDETEAPENEAEHEAAEDSDDSEDSEDSDHEDSEDDSDDDEDGSDDD